MVLDRIVPMNEEELLEQVRVSSDHSRRVHEAAMEMISDAAEQRAVAVKAALEAGVPRQKIADAAGTHRNKLYRIVDYLKK